VALGFRIEAIGKGATAIIGFINRGGAVYNVQIILGLIINVTSLASTIVELILKLMVVRTPATGVARV